MIKFFRKIRQSLLAEGKFVQYLKYAIGEIVLVVIGILIALSINNWNTERHERKVERELIASLVTDLEQDIIRLGEIIEFNEKKITGLDSLSRLGFQDLKNSDNVATVYSLTRRHIMRLYPFISNDRTLVKLKNSNYVGIVNKAVADSISLFQIRLDHIAGQTESYILCFRETIPITFRTMSLHYLSDSAYYKNKKLTGKPLPPLVQDQQVQMEFFNNVMMANAVTKYYLSDIFLGSQIKRTEQFIAFLKDTYELD